MTPELTALAALMADYFRDRAVPLVVASQAGLDTALIPGSDTIADLWWNVIERAHAEGLLGQLIEVAKKRVGTRKGVLDQAYQNVIDAEPTSVAAQPPAQPKRKRPPNGQDGARLSDHRMDARIDQMQRDMADMRVQVASLMSKVDTLTELVKTMTGENLESHELSAQQYIGLLLTIIVVAAVVFGVVYYGGNQ